MERPVSLQRFFARTSALRSTAVACAAFLVPLGPVARAQSTPPPATQQPADTPAPETQKLPPEQLDSLVAPIALFPDPLLSQTLVASTYPLEIMQLQQWLTKNKDLKDKALTDAAMKQPWDPSIQAMAVLPDVVKRLSDDIQWTTDLGNAFLAQQSEVMDAVQRMRVKAQGTGALASNEQQKVETKVVESKTVVVVEQTNPEVVYVPSYSPTVVYGPPVYPYPPIYYPPYPTGAVVAASMISFGVGIAIGAAWGGGGWGYGCGWGGNNVNINVNNNFVRNTNVNRNTNINNSTNISNRSNNNWSHDSSHRGGAPYADRSTANKYGGTARGESLSSRQPTSAGAQNRTGAQAQGASSRPQTSSSRPAGSSASTQGASRTSGGDNVGSRSVPSSSSASKSSGAFSGSSSGGSQARSSSSRGASSMGSSRGGGGRRR